MHTPPHRSNRWQLARARSRGGLLLSLLFIASTGCGALLGVAGYPPEATRTTKPVGIDDRAVHVGASIQPTVLADQDRASHTFGGPATERTLLVFYRGHW